MTLPKSFYVPLERDLLRLTGRDRQSFLQGMLTNDIASLTPGQGCYAFHLTSKGQILADMSVLCLDDCLLLDTEPGWGEPLAASLEHHLVMERVKIRLTTEIVYFIYEEGKWRALYDATSPPELPVCGEAIYEALRIEAGIPRGRVDFDEKTLAPETGQAGRAIHYKKGCYIGQEIVARIDARGHTNRSLVTLTTEQVVEPGTRLTVDGKDVGWITSAALGPTCSVPVALGYLRNEHAAPGTQVTVGAFGNGVVA
ncbi:YgfZ/GcvT domain-containing protein [Armatimonas sp.]|uniref:CAF17-like 4Fe-4S cluster assembly/insertion protein YgfZ n=1 Tax=Armatimonas sp. TaxID=1872638 RepID=UPI00374FF2E6